MDQRSEYISALRGISALSIIMLHLFAFGYIFKLGPEFKLGTHAISYILNLSMAAPFFLMLSAYSLCLSSAKKTDLGITSFYLRRFFRIAPLFYFMTLIIIFGNLLHGRSIPLISILGNVFFFYNFMPQFGYFKGIVGASWFIGVLMPFYLFFPLILMATRKITTTLWLFIISLIISFLFRLSLHWILSNGMAPQLNMTPDDIDFYGSFALIPNITYFILGIITYHIYGIIIKYEKQKLLGVMLLVMTIIAFIGLPNMSDNYFLNPIPLKYIISLFFITLTLSLAINKNIFLVNRFTVFMGKISYSLYLVHVLVIRLMVPYYYKIYLVLKSDWLAFICCYVMTVFVVTVISIFTHKFIELPGMNMGIYFEKQLRILLPSAFMASLSLSKQVPTHKE